MVAATCLLDALRSTAVQVHIRWETEHVSYAVHEKLLEASPFFAAQMRWNSPKAGKFATQPSMNSSSHSTTDYEGAPPSLDLELPLAADIESFELLLLGWYTEFHLQEFTVPQLLGLLSLCEVLMLTDLSALGVEELKGRTISPTDRELLVAFTTGMSESSLGRQLYALTYEEEFHAIEHLLFSRLPQMALEDEWENTGPERQEVLSFVTKHRYYEPLLDALEKCDFCKTFMRYEFPSTFDREGEEEEDPQTPKVSLLPNFFFVWEILAASDAFSTSSRPVYIMLKHLKSAMKRYRAFWEQNPFYLLYIELLVVSLSRYLLNKSADSEFEEKKTGLETEVDTLAERQGNALFMMEHFVDFAPKLDPVYPVCTGGHWMTTQQGLHRVCQMCQQHKADYVCTDRNHENALCHSCSFRPTTIKVIDAHLVLKALEEKLEDDSVMLGKCIKIFREQKLLFDIDTLAMLCKLDPTHKSWKLNLEAPRRETDEVPRYYNDNPFHISSMFGGMFVRPGK